MKSKPMLPDWQAMLDALAALEIEGRAMLAVLRHSLDLLAIPSPAADFRFDATLLRQLLLHAGFACKVSGIEAKWSTRCISADTLRRSLSAEWVRKVMGDERREFAALRIDFFHPNAEITFNVIPGLTKVLLTQPDVLLARIADENGNCALPDAAALDPSIAKPMPPTRSALLGEPGFWAENAARELLAIDQPASVQLAVEALGLLTNLRMLEVKGIRPAELPVLMRAIALHPKLRAAALDIEDRSIVDGQWCVNCFTDADTMALQAAWSECRQLRTLRVSWFPQDFLAVLLAQVHGLRRLGICGQIDEANRKRLLSLKHDELTELDLSRSSVAIDFIRQLVPHNLPALQKIGVMVSSDVEAAHDWNGAEVATFASAKRPADIKRQFLADRPWTVGCWFSDSWIFPGREHGE